MSSGSTRKRASISWVGSSNPCRSGRLVANPVAEGLRREVLDADAAFAEKEIPAGAMGPIEGCPFVIEPPAK